MKKIIVGFTGTRKGMTGNQSSQLIEDLTDWRAAGYEIEFHHGSCMGADVQADGIARNYKCEMYIHPSDNFKTMVPIAEPGDVVYPPKPCLVRDRDIVNVIQVLFAAPLTDTEVLRSGTWTTIRYAKKRGIEVYIYKR